MYTADTKKLVPIHKIVSAAMVDTYADISHAGVQQMYQHWIERGFKKLNNEVLKTGKIKSILTVNRNTKTATLPVGFSYELFVGVINHSGHRVPIKLSSKITDSVGIEEVEVIDKCPKCNANKAICKDLQITEDTVIVVIGNTTYEQTVIKKLYPNGDYYIETRIPVLNIETNIVEYTTQKEFIANINLKPCGCVEENNSNISIIKTCCPEVYCGYFAPCSKISLDSGYRIFEESGLIQFGPNFNFDKIYLEWRGVIPKINGKYQVPEICFETLVEWGKFKAIDGKPNVPLSVKDWRFRQYLRERGNMEKAMDRLSFAEVMQAINSLPKFDYELPVIECCPVSAPTFIPATLPAPSTDCALPSSVVPSPVKTFAPFDYAGIVGIGDSPREDQSTYQNDKFKNAIGINEIHIDNTTYTKLKGEFDINTTDGILTIAPNVFVDGSTLIVPTFFKLI